MAGHGGTGLRNSPVSQFVWRYALYNAATLGFLVVAWSVYTVLQIHGVRMHWLVALCPGTLIAGPFLFAAATWIALRGSPTRIARILLTVGTLVLSPLALVLAMFLTLLVKHACGGGGIS